MNGRAIGLLMLAWACSARAADAPAPSPAPVADKTSPPRLLPATCSRPEYPLASARARESGTTVARVAVTAQGDVTQATVFKTSDHPRLDNAFRYAVSLCRFEAARDANGVPVAGVAMVRHQWRLEDALPDPWEPLRAATTQANWTATEDVTAVPFIGATVTTPDQRAKILRRLQETSRENARCASIERVTPAPLPTEWKTPIAVASASGKSTRIAGEVWKVTQCDVAMRYGLFLRFPPDEPASFNMMPFQDDTDAALSAR